MATKKSGFLGRSDHKRPRPRRYCRYTLHERFLIYREKSCQLVCDAERELMSCKKLHETALCVDSFWLMTGLIPSSRTYTLTLSLLMYSHISRHTLLANTPVTTLCLNFTTCLTKSWTQAFCCFINDFCSLHIFSI